MSLSDFQSVVAAVGSSGVSLPSQAPDVSSVAILGADPAALAYAAHFLAGGAEVRLTSASGQALDALEAAGGITVRGDGLVGTFSVDPGADVGIEIVRGVDRAVRGADIVVVSGSVAAQRAAAMLAAPYLSDGQIVLVAPGLTFGALEAQWWLRSSAANADVTVAEIQTAPFRFESTRPASVQLTARDATPCSSIPANRSAGVLAALSDFLPGLVASPTVVHSSLADTSGLIEVPALVLGGPGLRPDPAALLPGAVPRDPEPLSDLMTEPMAAVIGRLASERRAVAERWGVRDIPADAAWLSAVHADGEPAPVETGESARRKILELTAASLVPLASAGAAGDVPTPTTRALVALVTAMFGFDLEAAGRHLSGIGLGGTDLDQIRRAVGPNSERTS